MLEPKSGRTSAKQSVPIKLLSKAKLKAAWNLSKDKKAKSRSAGVDGISPSIFAANLDENIDRLSQQIRKGSYSPSRLKTAFLPKENSNKERMICIPTVADRLIQKTIVDYLAATKVLPIYNLVSFGFIRESGPAKAIGTTLQLRTQYDWCLKTDIETFFDSIDRSLLKEKVLRSLAKSSLAPLIVKFIGCEIQTTPRNKEKIKKHGITLGVGIRQGMPLSPTLANLFLADFDRSVQRLKIPMVRYADDLVLFFESKDAAIKGRDSVREILHRLKLSIPEISDNSKTQLIGPRRPLDFLGRQIIYLDSEDRYVQTVSDKQIRKITSSLRDDYSYVKLSKNGDNFQSSISDLNKSIAAYRGLYKDAYNANSFEQNLRHANRTILSSILTDIFGASALSNLDNYKRNFLGIGELNFPEPSYDLDGI